MSLDPILSMRRAIDSSKAEQKAIKDNIAKKEQHLLNLESAIVAKEEEIKSFVSNIGVSDHAIVRYLERVLKVDINAMKAKILTDHDRHMIVFKGGEGAIKKKDMELRVSGYNVCTVIEAKS